MASLRLDKTDAFYIAGLTLSINPASMGRYGDAEKGNVRKIERSGRKKSV